MKKYHIVVDAMGSDNAPEPEVLGAQDAIKNFKNIEITLIGDESLIKKYLSNEERINVVHADEVVTPNEEPVKAVRKKKNSSLVKAFDMVKVGDADAFVSAGSTGAVLTGATFIIGRIKGIKRAALAPIFPTLNGKGVIICDVGANSDCRPDFLVQFARMADAYAKVIFDRPKTKVGLLNIGAEEKKGSELYKEAHLLLKEVPEIDFTGNIEARYMLNGDVDVVVSDGFAGNIALKTVEGTANMIMTALKEEIKSSKVSLIGALLMKKQLKQLKKRLDYKETGGAAFIGVNSPVVKAHGSSDAKAFMNAIRVSKSMCEGNVVESIRKHITE